MLNKTEHCKPVVPMHHGVFVVTRVSLQLPVMMMPGELRDSVLIQSFMNKGGVQSCIKLQRHTVDQSHHEAMESSRKKIKK